MRILAGSAAAAPGPRLTPPSTRFHTLVGQPRTIALQYPTGKEVRSPRDGKIQKMYTLSNGERAFFDLEVAAAIDSLTLAPGQPFTICNLGGGQWDVERAVTYEPAPLAPQPAPPPRLPPAAAGSNVTPALAQKVNGAGQTAGQILTSLYPAAIDVVLAGVALAREKGLMIAPTFEDVRCIATTLFIQQTGGRS